MKDTKNRQMEKDIGWEGTGLPCLLQGVPPSHQPDLFITLKLSKFQKVQYPAPLPPGSQWVGVFLPSNCLVFLVTSPILRLSRDLILSYLISINLSVYKVHYE